jgi:hypothetical protein
LGAGVTTQAAEEGLGAGVTQAVVESLRAGVTEAAAEGLGTGVMEAEETAETLEGAGRDRRAVLLGLLGVGVSTTRRRLVSSSTSSKASKSAKYALCFSKRSSSKLGALAMDHFCFRNDKQLENWKLWPP